MELRPAYGTMAPGYVVNVPQAHWLPYDGKLSERTIRNIGNQDPQEFSNVLLVMSGESDTGDTNYRLPWDGPSGHYR